MMPKRRSVVSQPGPRAAADRGRSRLGDTTRPISVDRRLTTGRGWVWLVWIAVIAGAGALAAGLFIVPIQTYLGQNDKLESRAEQLEQLEQVNADLRAEVERLQTADGIEEAAREQLGFQQSDEIRETIIDGDGVPTALPAGWPYDLVTGITNLRRGG